MRRDGGEIATAMTVAVSAAGITGIVMAVSEESARNATFGQAVLGIVVILLGGATWLNRRWNRALEDRITSAITKAINPLDSKVDALQMRAGRMEERQVTFQRQYEDDRLRDRERGKAIEAVAERNRQAAQDGRWDDLEPLPPFSPDPH